MESTVTPEQARLIRIALGAAVQSRLFVISGPSQTLSSTHLGGYLRYTADGDKTLTIPEVAWVSLEAVIVRNASSLGNVTVLPQDLSINVLSDSPLVIPPLKTMALFHINSKTWDVL
jgi:hypothetical protein